MILSAADIELLRLAAWCKNLPPDIHRKFPSQIFSPQEMEPLVMLGLMGLAKNRKSFRLWENGWQLLRYLGFDYHRDAGYRADYGRRLETANILLAFYRAGYDVFARDVGDLSASQVFLQSAAARRESAAGDLWGGAVFHGMASTGNSVAACYFVTGHEDALLHRRNERLLLEKASAMLRRGESQIFAGSDYTRLARALRNSAGDGGKGMASKWTFAEMYRNAPCPLYLLECSDTGALQLLIMAQENYRRRLVVAMAKRESSPPAGIRDADGEVQLRGEPHSTPLLIAADMDIKRIDRALRQAADSGYPKLALVCLEAQKKALEYLYGGARVSIFVLTPRTVSDAFGDICLYEPAPAAYLSPEGGVIDAANLPVGRKAGEKI